MSAVPQAPEAALAETGCHAFNRALWARPCGDPVLAELDYRIEFGSYGQIIVPPPPAPGHGKSQAPPSYLIRSSFGSGRALSECPVSTRKRVYATVAPAMGHSIACPTCQTALER